MFDVDDIVVDVAEVIIDESVVFAVVVPATAPPLFSSLELDEGGNGAGEGDDGTNGAVAC